MVLVLVQVTAIVAAFGMPAAITRHGIIERSGAAGARALVVWGAVLAIAISGATALTSSFWSTRLELGRHELITGVACACCLSIVAMTQALLRVLDRPFSFITLSACGSFIGPTIGLVIVSMTEPSAQHYLLGLLVGYGLAACFGISGVLASDVNGERGDLAKAFRIGLPTIPHQLALYLASGALVVLAGHVIDRPSSGRLQLAILLGTAPAIITSSLNNSWAPVMYKANADARGYVLEETSRQVAFFTATVCTGVALLSPWALRFIAPTSYSPDQLVEPVAVIATGCLLAIAYLSNVHLVFISGKSAGLAAITPLGLTVALVVAWKLGGEIGLNGLAAGFPISYFFLATLTALLARRVSEVRWRMGRLATPIILGGLGCSAGALLPIHGGLVAFRVVLALAVGMLGLLLLRQVTRQVPTNGHLAAE